MRARRVGVVAVMFLVGCRTESHEPDQHLVERLSAEPSSTLPRAGSAARPRLVFIAQTEASDCGPAALAMTLSYYGHPVTLDATKAAMHFHADAEGTTALDVVEAATARGLGVVGVAGDVGTVLPVLRAGDILHFDTNHFVVFDAVAADGVRLMDPSVGPVLLPRAAFATHFSEVALLFERSPAALAVRKRAIGLPSTPDLTAQDSGVP